MKTRSLTLRANRESASCAGSPCSSARSGASAIDHRDPAVVPRRESSRAPAASRSIVCRNRSGSRNAHRRRRDQLDVGGTGGRSGARSPGGRKSWAHSSERSEKNVSSRVSHRRCRQRSKRDRGEQRRGRISTGVACDAQTRASADPAAVVDRRAKAAPRPWLRAGRGAGAEARRASAAGILRRARSRSASCSRRTRNMRALRCPVIRREMSAAKPTVVVMPESRLRA